MVLGPDHASAGSKAVKYTPLEQQVIALKKRHPGLVLLVECGYKFRLFGEDAELAARTLNIYAFADKNFMTASVPIHRLHVYVRRLVRKGHKVAVARQMETAALKAASDTRNKVFERKVTAVYTPATLEAGTCDDVGEEAAQGSADLEDALDSASSYLMCLHEEGAGGGRGDVSFVAMDPTLSSIYWGCCKDRVTSGVMESTLMYFKPKEVLLMGQLSSAASRLVKAFADTTNGTTLEYVPAVDERRHMRIQEITELCSGAAGKEGFQEQLEGLEGGVLAAMLGAFSYLHGLGLRVWDECGITLRPVAQPGHMNLSSNALAQLHVLTGETTGTSKHSLLQLVGATRSAAGARLLRQWLSQPLVCVSSIEERQAAVQGLLDHPELLDNIQQALSAAPDIDRAVGRAFLSRASPAEFVAAMRACDGLPRALLGALPGGAGGALGAEANEAELSGTASAILLQLNLRAACAPDMVQRAGDFLALLHADAAKANDYTALFACEARFPAVFERHAELRGAVAVLEGLLPDLAKRAGVPKVAYTSIQNQGDYLIELPVATRAPKAWLKICATKKMNRFRPPEVAEAMRQKDMAAERLQAECKAAWLSLLESFGPHCPAFRAAARALATLDCLQALAGAASEPGLCRPEFVDEAAPAQITIRGGRAPVLDALLPQGAVPNDVALAGDGLRMMVISGPNMGGKSSYMASVAQLVLLAQAGAWVPADAMRLRVVDAIHTRMGAHDNILQGRSTFLEELLDTSHLLARASAHSLVILDELGRGTATHDGVAVAVATMEHLVRTVRCQCLFVTHYPEVCQAAAQLEPHARSFHMAYRQVGNWKLGPAMPALMAGSPDTRATTRPALLDGNGENVRGDNGTSAGTVAAVATGAKAAGTRVQKVLFLYKLKEGTAGASFGLNVAMLAGLPHDVVARAAALAQGLHATSVFHVPEEGGAGEGAGALVAEILSAVAAGHGGGVARLEQLQAKAKQACQAL